VGEMTLEEQYEKETGLLYSERYTDIEKICWRLDFGLWLKEKLTWKKFSEQKPDSTKPVFCKSKTMSGEAHYFTLANPLWREEKPSSEAYEVFINETEWMYAQN
jgi:hypothetical protein